MSLTGALGFTVFPWANVSNNKDLYSSFQETLLTEFGTSINKISVMVDGYTVESTKCMEQKRSKKNLA